MPQAEMWDLVIVGGGPGGLFAANLMSSKGFRVALLEEHEIAGKPVHCTGILAADAFREFDLPRDPILNTLTTARFYSPLGKHFSYSPKTAEAVVVDRCEFDAILASRARKAGTELLLGKRASFLILSKNSIEVQRSTDRHSIHARACILASGANYGFQRQLGLGFPPVYLNTAQLEVDSSPRDEVEIYFGADVAPQGFAWVVPVRRASRSYARVGLMCSGNSAQHFDHFLKRVARLWGISADVAVTPRQKVLPLSPIRKTYAERLLVIGDAAGLAKPTTGGGIYYSILSAAIAADVLASALAKDDLSEDAMREYERRWKARLSEELEAQLTLRLLANRLTDDEIEGLFELALTNGLMPLIRKTAKFNRHRELIAGILKHQESRKILFRRWLI